MEKEIIRPLKSLITESKKIRAERGEDFFSNKKIVTEIVTAKIQQPSEAKDSQTEIDLQKIRKSHQKLNDLISDYDKNFFDQNNQVLTKKTRSKSLHLYVDETIETFLKKESQKAETKWGLRKNAGLGQLIQKFILNFIELKKREERQLKRVKKVIDEFQTHLVEFKKSSGDPGAYQNAEKENQTLKALSNDLNILLALLEFEDGDLKNCLGSDLHSWIDLIRRWKFQS